MIYSSHMTGLFKAVMVELRKAAEARGEGERRSNRPHDLRPEWRDAHHHNEDHTLKWDARYPPPYDGLARAWG